MMRICTALFFIGMLSLVFTACPPAHKNTGTQHRAEKPTHSLQGRENARTVNLENYLGLYQISDTRCELTDGLYNPCPKICFIELVKGIFHGTGPDEVAIVNWKMNKDDTQATYEARPVRHHRRLPMKGNKIWLTKTADKTCLEYFILKNGNIDGYRLMLTTTNPAGKIFKRDFYYQLTKVLRKQIKAPGLEYPGAFPFLEKDRDIFSHSSDAIYKTAIIDKHLSADFFNSTTSSLKWHIIRHDDGIFEDVLDGTVTGADKIPVEHTSNCISTHQGAHAMNFCDAALVSENLRLLIHGGMPAYNSSLLIEVKKNGLFSCFFNAVYPAASPTPSALEWKITAKKLYLNTLQFEPGKQIYGRLSVEFEEHDAYRTDLPDTYKIEGFIKPVIKEYCRQKGES